MDSVRCVEPEALDEVLASPADDPRHLHLVTCPRCRALAGSYGLFLTPVDNDPARTREADAALTAFREKLLGSDAPVRRAVREEPRSWWRALFAPALRPAWAFAALAIVAGSWYVAAHRAPAEDQGIRLRGATQAQLALSAPRFQPDGSVALAWQPHPEAESYEVRFYSTSLAELGRLPVVTATSVQVPAAQLPAPPAAGDVLLYRIAALRGGDVIALSPVGTLQRP